MNLESSLYVPRRQLGEEWRPASRPIRLSGLQPGVGQGCRLGEPCYSSGSHNGFPSKVSVRLGCKHSIKLLGPKYFLLAFVK